MTPSESVDRELLAAVLDCLIPAEGGFPAGGAVALDHVLRTIEKQPTVAALLARVEQSGPAGFSALAEAEQVAVLRGLEAEQPSAFAALVVAAYSGYYTHRAVLERLGLDPTPPQPRGHVLEPFDERVLERVRQRGPIYRTP